MPGSLSSRKRRFSTGELDDIARANDNATGTNDNSTGANDNAARTNDNSTGANDNAARTNDNATRSGHCPHRSWHHAHWTWTRLLSVR